MTLTLECPHCRAALDEALAGEVSGEYDEIDLPVFTPVVHRHRRLAVICPGCRKRVKATLPDAAHGFPLRAAAACSGGLSQDVPVGVIRPA